MADDATQIELCFVRFNAAKAAFERATAHRKRVQTHHSPPWYEAVKEEAECFKCNVRGVPGPSGKADVPAGEAVMEAGSPTWYLQSIPQGEAAATPA
ncbi:hypothetical protein BH24CHL8_BH24CHL8_06450 [soil metagenome]